MSIVTQPFEETMKALIKDQGVPEMALVVVEHPIAGHNPEAIRKKVDQVFPDILRAATKWQPAGK